MSSHEMVLGQACFLVSPSLATNHIDNLDSVSRINQRSIVPNQTDPGIVNQPQPLTVFRDDYEYTPGIGGHKVHTEALDWNQAKLACEAEHAKLAIVNSAAESAVIARLLTDSKPHVGSWDSRYAFIGFNDIDEEGSYKTIHGEPLSESGFYEWASGEPNNGNGAEEDCGSIFHDGKLNDAWCSGHYAFICELPSPEVLETPAGPQPQVATP